MSITLDKVARHQKVRVLELAGGHRFHDRLAGLGIGLGCEIEILQQAQGRGGLLIARDQSRLALGRGMARKIIVEPILQPQDSDFCRKHRKRTLV